MLVTAENLIECQQRQNKKDMELLWARLTLRKLVLCRAFLGFALKAPGQTDEQEMSYILHQEENRPTNCYLGELVLFNAQKLISSDPKKTLRVLNEFKPLNETSPSSREQGIMGLINLTKAKALRYLGRFDEANDLFDTLVEGSTASAWVLPRIDSHRAAVYCELTLTAKAMTSVNYALSSTECTEHDDKHRSSRLALAGIFLMEGLWHRHKTRRSDERSHAWLQKAKSIYHELQRAYDDSSSHGRVAKLGQYSTLAGLGMIAHLENEVEEWSSYFRDAAAIAESYGGSQFIQLLKFYGQAGHLRRSRDFRKSEHIMTAARELFKVTGRQYFLLGGGSVYFDIVGDLLENEGGERLDARLHIPVYPELIGYSTPRT